MSVGGTNVCADCGYCVERSSSDNVKRCPKCGSEKWLINIVVQDSARCYEEFGLTATNKQGQIVGERIQKTDLNTRADFSADLGKPSKIRVNRENRVVTFEEEGAAAVALIGCYNRIRCTNYKVEEKTQEDNDYADRVFISEKDQPIRMNVQIRHLDGEIIGTLGKYGMFDGDRITADVIASIQAAIDDKAIVDPELKAKTILQLILPSPLGTMMRQMIENNLLDFKGFKEIWISPFHEESFPLKAC